MNNALGAAQALVKNFIEPTETQELLNIFQRNEPFLKVIEAFDKWVDRYPTLNPIAEYLFDILLAYHLDKQRGNEDYLFSKEWMDIEDKIIDRGTELLNLLIYISEAKENDIEMDLVDFLNEFLLVDEDEFQDEHHIYETIIDNAQIVELEQDAFYEALTTLSDDNLGGLLKPLFLFFYSPNQRMNAARLMPDEQAIYQAILAYAEVG